MDEEAGTVLGAVNEADDYGDGDDIEMLDVEDGELVDATDSEARPVKETETNFGVDGTAPSQSNNSQRRGKRKKKKKKNKAKKGGSGFRPISIDRFVLDTCRRLKEKKSYMVYTAVGYLGMAALNDIVNEVHAIQACGGQMTADGKRARTGGGILWNILKVREPAAYSEIMKKTKEFEKQFKQPNIRKVAQEVPTASQQGTVSVLPDGESVHADADNKDKAGNQTDESTAERKRKSVHERIRVPVSYDDLVVEDLNAD